jgi:ribosome-associated heat shock protein Hsp15
MRITQLEGCSTNHPFEYLIQPPLAPILPLTTLILPRYTRSMADDTSLRLDIWLDVACIYKTRSQAQTACKNGRVEVNGDHGKAHRAVRPGDEIKISLPGGRKRTIEVVGLESTNVSKARARELYIDHTPPPTPEEIELRKMQRLSMPTLRSRGMGAPKKQERRQLRRLKEGEEF